MPLRKVVEDGTKAVEHRKILDYDEIGDIFGDARAGGDTDDEVGEVERDLDGEIAVDRNKRRVVVDDDVAPDYEEDDDDDDVKSGRFDVDQELREELRRAEELAGGPELGSMEVDEDDETGAAPREKTQVDEELEEELRRAEELSIESGGGNGVQDSKSGVWSEEEEDRAELFNRRQKTKMRMYADVEAEEGEKGAVSLKGRVKPRKGRDFADLLRAEKRRQGGEEFGDVDPAKIVITMDNEDSSEEEEEEVAPIKKSMTKAMTKATTNKRLAPDSKSKLNGRQRGEATVSSENGSRFVERVVEKSGRRRDSSSSSSSSSSDSSSSSSESTDSEAEKRRRNAYPVFATRSQLIKTPFERVSPDSRSKLRRVQRSESPAIVVNKTFGAAGLGGASTNGSRPIARPSISQRLKEERLRRPPHPLRAGEFVGLAERFGRDLDSEDDGDAFDGDVRIEYDQDDDIHTRDRPLSRRDVISRLRGDLPRASLHSRLGKRAAPPTRKREDAAPAKIQPLMEINSAPRRSKSEARQRAVRPRDSDGDDRFTDDDEFSRPAIKKFASGGGGGGDCDLRDRIGGKGGRPRFGMRADLESAPAQARLGDLRSRKRRLEMERFDRVESNLSLAFAVAESGGKLRSDR